MTGRRCSLLRGGREGGSPTGSRDLRSAGRYSGPAIRKNRIGRGPSRFFPTCHSPDTLTRPGPVPGRGGGGGGGRESVEGPSIFALCEPGQQTVAAAEGRRGCPPSPRHACLPACPPFFLSSLAWCGISGSRCPAGRSRAALIAGNDKSVRSVGVSAPKSGGAPGRAFKVTSVPSRPSDFFGVAIADSFNHSAMVLASAASARCRRINVHRDFMNLL